MDLAGGTVGSTGRDVFHAAVAASPAAAHNGRETAVATQAILTELDVLRLPALAEVCRRVGREACKTSVRASSHRTFPA